MRELTTEEEEVPGSSRQGRTESGVKGRSSSPPHHHTAAERPVSTQAVSPTTDGHDHSAVTPHTTPPLALPVTFACPCTGPSPLPGRTFL